MRFPPSTVTAEKRTAHDEIRFNVTGKQFPLIPGTPAPKDIQLKFKRRDKESGEFLASLDGDLTSGRGTFNLELVLFAPKGRVKKFKFFSKSTSKPGYASNAPLLGLRDLNLLPGLPSQKQSNGFAIVRRKWDSEYGFEKRVEFLVPVTSQHHGKPHYKPVAFESYFGSWKERTMRRELVNPAYHKPQTTFFKLKLETNLDNSECHHQFILTNEKALMQRMTKR